MGQRCLQSCCYRITRAMLVVAVPAMILSGLGRAALADTPYQQTYLACSNGDHGNVAACQRLCRLFLNRRDNPLGTMRSTCLRRLDTKRNILTDPD